MNNIDNYRIVYYFSDDDNCFLASIPDLPGCISDGATVSEAIDNVRALAKDWIEVTKDAGEPIPEPSLTAFPSGDSLSIYDVASYILHKTGKITTKALQKLLFYCKAWSLGWYGMPLFPEPFEAWREGPINRELYYKHAGTLIASPSMLRHNVIHDLSSEQQQFVDFILDAYRDVSADALGEMTHKEAPWKNARGPLPPGASCNTQISDLDMEAYYGQAANRP